MMKKDVILDLINTSLETVEKVKKLQPQIEKVSEIMIECLKKGNKIMACGNGGSALQAQHFTGEIIGKLEVDKRALAGLCLNIDGGAITAISNDYGYRYCFKRQIEGLGRKGDVLVCFSTSGNSENLIEAVKDIKGITVINILGRDGGKLKGTGDVDIIVDSNSTNRIQECHLLILHIIAKLIENWVLKK
jgi:phosphoheptose isomerase